MLRVSTILWICYKKYFQPYRGCVLQHLSLSAITYVTVVLEVIDTKSILCLTPRTSVTSLSASNDTRCKTYPLCVNPGVPF